jgi:hypothetical protein
MLIGPQLDGVAEIPLNATLPFPVDCVAPKLRPAMVTEEPTAPVVGRRLVREGIGTIKLNALLARLETVTTMLPVVAPDGTGTTILDMLQLVAVAVTLLNFTVLVP